MELAYWDNYSQVAEPEKIQIKPKPDKNTPAKLQTADELLNLGLYKTGKKLNLKKIIPFIASNYRKDKIWLRRT